MAKKKVPAGLAAFNAKRKAGASKSTAKKAAKRTSRKRSTKKS